MIKSGGLSDTVRNGLRVRINCPDELEEDAVTVLLARGPRPP